ncbi:hypothetical protein MCAP1_002955 [Malassezia caprae]|uniref:Uncharacterized protein n=1 Tax=Malassezia caprae TaxID=1381934 RepID=A0AAF0EAJ3_9BASI|nr:hypothetical protein MCAP1_002955 [Malassezia caprae]
MDESDLGGAPPSPSTLTDIILSLHASLYGAKRSVDEIRGMVWRYYDNSAVFDSPVVLAHGRQHIADQFVLAFALPGLEVRSELRDVICSDFEFDGTRAGLIDHTVTVTLFPQLVGPAPESSESSRRTSGALTSQGSITPHPESPDDAPIIPLEAARSTWNAPDGLGRRPAWAFLYDVLRPSRFLRKLLSVELRILSRLEFNEAGRIVSGASSSSSAGPTSSHGKHHSSNHHSKHSYTSNRIHYGSIAPGGERQPFPQAQGQNMAFANGQVIGSGSNDSQEGLLQSLFGGSSSQSSQPTQSAPQYPNGQLDVPKPEEIRSAQHQQVIDQLEAQASASNVSPAQRSMIKASLSSLTATAQATAAHTSKSKGTKGSKHHSSASATSAPSNVTIECGC